MRKFSFGLLYMFLMFSFAHVFANEKKMNEETIQEKINFLKQILNSKDWVPTDTLNYDLISELIGYLESSPVDSIEAKLKEELKNKEIFFVRDCQKIKDTEHIKGYVSQDEIIKKLKEIEEEVTVRNPINSIPVPEEIFTGSYSKLDFIDKNELDKLVIDSNIVLPDTLQALLSSPVYLENDSFKNHVDSMKTAFLNEQREIYNKTIVVKLRDSLSQKYRIDFVKNLVDEAKKNYLDSVMTVNNNILTRYNDSKTLTLNHDVKESVKTLVSYLNRVPNELNIYNLANDKSTISLQNDGVWFKWIWLKNAQNDSLGIRIENLDRNSMRMLVDESVNLSHLTKKETLEINNIKPMERRETKLKKITPRNPVLSPWKFVGKAYSGFTQNYINEFWSQGGKSSASALTTFNYTASYGKNKITWESFADIKLGVIYYIPMDSTETMNWHKNSDSFELNSRVGYSAFKKWYYSAEANFKTQTFLGYKNLTDTVPSSAFFSPAYLTFSAGLEYKPGKNFSAFLSPISLKTTYVTNPRVNETKFGLNEGETHHSRIGISGKVDYSRSLFENISVKTKNSIFVNVGNNNAGEWQFLKLPDFDSETSIDFKVNQFISTQVNLHFIYDKDVESTWTLASGVEKTGSRLQVKEFLTLGFSYKF